MNKVFSGEKKTLRDWGLTRWQKGRRFNTLTTLDHHFLQLHYDLLTSWNSLSLFCASIIPFRGGDLCPGTFGTPKLRNAASRYLVLSWEANDACIINKGLLIEAIEATVHQSSDSRGWTLTLLFAFFCSNTWRSWSITWRQWFSHLKMNQITTWDEGPSLFLSSATISLGVPPILSLAACGIMQVCHHELHHVYTPNPDCFSLQVSTSNTPCKTSTVYARLFLHYECFNSFSEVSD